MGKEAVCLILKAKTAKGWRRLPVVKSTNGKLRAQFGIYEKEKTLFPDGVYHLRSYRGSKQVFTRIGTDPTKALQALQRELRRQDAIQAVGRADDLILVDRSEKRVRLDDQRDRIIDDLIARNKKRAAQTMRLSIDDFLHITHHTYTDEITSDSIIEFYKGLRERGRVVRKGGGKSLKGKKVTEIRAGDSPVEYSRAGDISDRTIFNKSADIATWFRHMKLDVKALISNKVDYTKREVEIYETHEMAALFEACGQGYHRTVYQTLLMSGMREQEAANLRWVDVDFNTSEIRIRESDTFTIKDKERRTIPVPALIPILRAWRETRPGSRLLFGTNGGQTGNVNTKLNEKPSTKWLANLHRIVRKAGLHCGGCDPCLANKGCEKWWVHKFRATFTTSLLRSGLDARSVMSITGHSDLSTVMRYWAPVGSKASAAVIKHITWA